jgi:hypothetical protein
MFSLVRLCSGSTAIAVICAGALYSLVSGVLLNRRADRDFLP